MSIELVNRHEKNFEQTMSGLKVLLEDRCKLKALGRRNPYEYDQAQNHLSQMEIEVMEFISSHGGPVADRMRQRINKHKKDFEVLRREMRSL